MTNKNRLPPLLKSPGSFLTMHHIISAEYLERSCQAIDLDEVSGDLWPAVPLNGRFLCLTMALGSARI